MAHPWEAEQGAGSPRLGWFCMAERALLAAAIGGAWSAVSFYSAARVPVRSRRPNGSGVITLEGLHRRVRELVSEG